MSNAPKPQRPDSTDQPTPDYSGMPEFVRAIRGLAHVPKAEADEAANKKAKRNKAANKSK